MKLTKPVVVLSCLSVCTFLAKAQETYTRRNTLAAVVEYSNDSSHIILGAAPNRKFAGLGVQYQRRLIAGRGMAWSYFAELRPLVLESDPTASGTETTNLTSQNGAPPLSFTSPFPPQARFKCVAGTTVQTFTGSYSGTVTTQTTCSRDWNFAQSFSPIGTRLNLRTHHRLQPTISGSLGYMFATHAIPVDNAGAFNFVFELGAGLELYRTGRRSVRAEYQVQHFSNKDSAPVNPGVDNGLFKLTYCFGR